MTAADTLPLADAPAAMERLLVFFPSSDRPGSEGWEGAAAIPSWGTAAGGGIAATGALGGNEFWATPLGVAVRPRSAQRETAPPPKTVAATTTKVSLAARDTPTAVPVVAVAAPTVAKRNVFDAMPIHEGEHLRLPRCLHDDSRCGA